MRNDLVKFGTVGVVIPTYQRWESTERAVKSVLNQGYPIEQIIVVDDGSDPEVKDALRKALEDYPVKLILSPRVSNPGICRQLGTMELNTKWVAFLDSDDEWHENKISTQLASLTSSKSKAAATNAFRVKPDNSKEIFFENLPKKINLRKLKKKNLLINSSVIVDRELLLECGGISTSYSVRGCEDYATWLRVATKTNWNLIDEPLVSYDDTETNNSIRSSFNWSNSYSDILAILDFSSWKRSQGKSEKLVRAILKLLRL